MQIAPNYITLLLLIISVAGYAQVSSDCSTAIPICYDTPINGGTNGFGADDFNGQTSSGCLEATTTGAIESNSAWYYFRIGASGQLGFNIQHKPEEDWDFALYRATDCSNLGEPVRCNFFDNREGASATGVGEDPNGVADSVQYEDWLTVTPGEQYYLMVNNFSNNNDGFSIQFTGQIFTTNPYDALDCDILDNILGGPKVACQGEIVTLDATTEDATGYNWFINTNSGYQQITGEHDAILEVTGDGTYRVEVLTGSENLISDVQVSFSAVPVAMAVQDEVVCQNEIGFTLTDKDAEVLGAQSAEAFLVSYHSTLSDANLGINRLESPYLTNPGEEIVYVRLTNRLNPNCYDASVQFELNILASPDLGPDETALICANNGSVQIGVDNPDSSINYSWSTGEASPIITVTTPGTYILTTENSFGNVNCIRTKVFTVEESIIPEIQDIVVDDFSFKATVTVNVVEEGDFQYRIDDEDFKETAVFENVLPGLHTIHIRDAFGCGVVREEIVVMGFMPFFTPNGDGNNDVWQIYGLEELSNPVVAIFDRYGKLLKQFGPNDTSWDGTYNNVLMPPTDFWFSLQYENDQGERRTAKYIQNHFALKL